MKRANISFPGAAIAVIMTVIAIGDPPSGLQQCPGSGVCGDHFLRRGRGRNRCTRSNRRVGLEA
jgi:hypothetical protein